MIKYTLAAAFAALIATSATAAPVAPSAQPVAPATRAVEMTAAQMDTIVAGAQPADPGGFGADRAAWIQANGSPGAILSGRAGDNGAINNDYKVSHGDLPAGVTPGQ